MSFKIKNRNGRGNSRAKWISKKTKQKQIQLIKLAGPKPNEATYLTTGSLHKIGWHILYKCYYKV